jgi:hypothetical protein
LATLATTVAAGTPITSLSVQADPRDPRGTVGTSVFVPAGTTLQLASTPHTETVVTSAAVAQGSSTIPIVSYTPTYSYSSGADVNVWVPAVHEVANLEVVDRGYEEAGCFTTGSGITDNGAVVLYSNVKLPSTGFGQLQLNSPNIYSAQVQVASCNLDSGIEVVGNLASLDIGSSNIGVRVSGTSHSCINVNGGMTVSSLNVTGCVVNGKYALLNSPIIDVDSGMSSVLAANFVGCQGLNISALYTGSGTVVANVIDGTGFFAAALQSGFTSPPVSGTAYVNSSARNVTLYQTVTLNPSATNTATLTLSISPDGVTYTQVAELQIPANGAAWAGQIKDLAAVVPAGWYYKFAATNATLGALVVGG